MQNIISQLKEDPDKLKEQILRHQKPIAFMVMALVEQLKYEKSLMPDHLFEPFMNSTKEYIMKELDVLN